MSHKVLVLGASGIVGGEVIKELHRQKLNLEIRAGVREKDLPKFSTGDIRGIHADFDRPDVLRDAMADCHTVFVSVPFDERMRTRCVHVLRAAHFRQIKYLIWSSFINSHTDSKDMAFREYGRIDALVRESGLDYCILHPNSFMQTFPRYYVDRINSAGELYSVQDSHTRTSFIDLRDYAAACAAVLRNTVAHPRAEYTLTGPDAVSNDEIARTIGEHAGRTVVYIQQTAKQYIYAKREERLSDWMVDACLSVNDHVSDGKQETLTVDAFALTKVPLISFQRYVKDYSHVWRRTSTGRVGMRRFPGNVS